MDFERYYLDLFDIQNVSQKGKQKWISSVITSIYLTC
jgi:hypothetical protein